MIFHSDVKLPEGKLFCNLLEGTNLAMKAAKSSRLLQSMYNWLVGSTHAKHIKLPMDPPFKINVNESQLNKLAKTGLVDRICPFIWGVIFPIIILVSIVPELIITQRG